MALKLNIQNNNTPTLLDKTLGVEGVSEFYIRVDRFAGELKTCRFILGFYSRVIETIEEEEVITLHKLNIPEVPYEFEMIEDSSEGDVNLRQQAYNYLKTLPEFSECEDC